MRTPPAGFSHSMPMALTLTLVLALALTVVMVPSARAALVINDLHRTVLAGHMGSLLTYDFAAVRISNPSDSTVAESVFDMLLSPSRASRMSFVIARTLDLAAFDSASPESFKSFNRDSFLETYYHAAENPIASSSSSQSSGLKVTIHLENALAPGESAALQILTAYNDAIRPLPAEIPQETAQTVKFEDTLGFGSPYETKSYICRIHTGKGKKLSYTKKTKSGVVARVEAEFVIYGPFTHDPVSQIVFVHFENSMVGLHYLSWRREVWVRSLDKKLEFDEWIHVAHKGAKILGQFNRFAMLAHDPNSPTNRIQKLLLFVPKYSRDIFLRDDIGNVSTSSIMDEYGYTMDGNPAVPSKLFLISPRFPLYGGWEYNWNHGYEIDASGYLHRKSPSDSATDEDGAARESALSAPYELLVPLIDGVESTAVDYVELKIVLPEGAQIATVEVVGNGRVKELFAASTEGGAGGVASDGKPTVAVAVAAGAAGSVVAQGEYELSKTYYYLDTVGRPTVTVRVTKFITRAPYAAAPAIRVRYTLTMSSFVLKPLLASTVTLALLGVLLRWLLRAPSKMERAAHRRGMRAGVKQSAQ